jgi:preprotein translocase subunit SecB
MLEPIDFAKLYHQQIQAAAEQQAGKSDGDIVVN